MAVVKEDVVKLTFQFNDKEMVDAEIRTDELLDAMQKLGGKQGTGKAEDGFDDAAKAAKKFGETSLTKLSSGLDKITSSVGKIALNMGSLAAKGLLAGTAAATAGIAALGTQAVKSYAEYEQLVGGVETLFGTGGMSLKEYSESVNQSTDSIRKFQKEHGLVVDGIIGKNTAKAMQESYKQMQAAEKMVLTNANNAYKTAGLSANDYMETVTGFSASLIQSLGGDTQKAAKLSDQAIVDMADNANKMGSDLTSLSDAYKGFSRGQFQLLDNLKLGYGGTKEEMQRLLKDAEKLTGQKYDISNFADITEAIHAIQVEMGIAGTTSKEASETIQGSALAMSAAWQNFIGGMANEDADFDQLFDNLIDSVVTFTNNLIPRIKIMLPRLIRGLTEIGKTIGKELPGLMKDLVPELAKGVRELLGSALDVVRECGPLLKSAGLEAVKAIYEGFTGKEMSGDMFATLSAKVDQAVKAFNDITAGVVEFGGKLLNVLGPALVWIGDLALQAFTWIGDNIDWLLPVLGSLLGAMLAFKAVKKVTGIVSGFMGIFGKGGGKGGAGGLEGMTGGSGGSGGGLFSGFANIKPTTILKGMANLGIILIGLGALAAIAAWAAPYVTSLCDAGQFVKLMAAIAIVGLVGTGMTKLAGAVGNIPVATVAKGLANIAIIMGGLGLLTVIFGYVAKLDFDMVRTLQLVGLIGVTGLVGSALAGLAGTVGIIPTPIVLTGLANIALILGGFTAVVAAFAALSMIDGFNDFMAKGGETLSQICGIIGEMAGSLIGGFGEGLTDSLPAIGENLSAFATSIQPMFDTFAGVDAAGLKDFSLALLTLIGVLAGESILSIITGGIDYAGLGTNLTTMATNMSGFFSTIMAFPDGGFEKATALFNCLAGIASLPKEGGVVGWFQGEVNFANMATGLNQLAGTTGFFTAIQAIPEEAFTKATQLFDCLAGVSALPKDGGIAQWFTGTINYESLVSGIQLLAGEGMIAALTAIAGIPETAYTGLTAMFDALGGIKAIPSEGGIFGWFTGENSTGLTNIANELPGVATNIAAFFENLGGLTDFTPISSLFDTLGSIELNTNVADKGFWSGVSQLGSMGTELAAFATNGSAFFTMINSLNLENLTSFFDVMGGASELPTNLEGIDGALGTVLSNMNTTVSDGMTTIKTTIETGLTACITVFATKFMTFYDSGAAIMNGLNLGMLSKKETLINTANSIASAISRTIDNALDINSPSRVMIEKGEHTGGGFAIGMQNSIPEIKAATNEISYASIPYASSYSPETSSNYYNGGSSDYYSISPSFTLTISGSQDDRALARKVQRYVSEAMEKTFESLERKNNVYREA